MDAANLVQYLMGDSGLELWYCHLGQKCEGCLYAPKHGKWHELWQKNCPTSSSLCGVMNGKQYKAHFEIRGEGGKTSDQAFEIIHSDMCGLMRITFMDG